MERRSGAATVVPVVLLLLTSLTILSGVVRAVQVPTGTLTEDALKFTATPVALWLHATAGALFGLLGPVQFSFALRRRFGTWHRRSGRVFAVAGAVLGLSGLRLADRFGGQIDPTDMARTAFGALLLVCLWQGIAAIRAGDRDGHRDWMIRAYAVGMGTAPLALVYLPIFVILGDIPRLGALDHVIFVGIWLGSIAVGEAAIRRLHRRAPTYSAA